MHKIQIGKETITKWEHKAPHLQNDDVIGQLLCGNSLHVDKKGYLFNIRYDYKLFHAETKEMIFHTEYESLYDMARDNVLPTFEEVLLVYQKAYESFKEIFDERKMGTNLETVELVPFSKDLPEVRATFESIQKLSTDIP